MRSSSAITMKKEGLLHKKIILILSSVITVFTLLLLVHLGTIDSIEIKSSLNCDCVRQVTHRKFIHSICDNFSSKRDPGQKIVSYTFYGNSSEKSIRNRYLDPVQSRAEEIRRLYPDWVMRIYYDLEENDTLAKDKLCQIWCQNWHVDLCDVTDLPLIGNLKELQPVGRTWRFVPLMDPSVDVILSRDLDSIISTREVAAVNEFLRSPRRFHIMRDHPSHNGYILAGLWGAKIDQNRLQMSALAQAMFESTPRDYWDYDQALLRRIIWPAAVQDSLQHDSFSCSYPKFNAYHPTQPFPTPRKGQFYVGWGSTKGSENQTGIKPCPSKCRADPSWILC